MARTSTQRFVPAEEDLNRLDRDLRFHPSAAGNPSMLTPEQIEAFNREGYLKSIRIFSDEEIAAIARQFDELPARRPAVGGDSYSISREHLRYTAPSTCGMPFTGWPLPTVIFTVFPGNWSGGIVNSTSRDWPGRRCTRWKPRNSRIGSPEASPPLR
jgi:hypothetical protein